MAGDNIWTYKFKPFELNQQANHQDTFRKPKILSDAVCSDAYLIAYGFDINEPWENELWKYSFDSNEWKVIPCKNIPQKLHIASTIIILSGSIIIIIGSTISDSRLGNNRIYLGNLDDEYKECGMKFEELELSGDKYSDLYGLMGVMDGKFVYVIGYESFDKCAIVVQLLDLSTKKWEILQNPCVDVNLDIICNDQPVFYKGGIYVFGFEDYTINEFLKVYKFDVASKTWAFIPANPELWPSFIHRKYDIRCVQPSEKSNLVYLFRWFPFMTWRFNIDNHQWEELKWDVPMSKFSFRKMLLSATTPSGQMYSYCYSNTMLSAWLTIPKLKTMSWDAMMHYFKEELFASSTEHLKGIGLPKEFYERIIEARRTKSY